VPKWHLLISVYETLSHKHTFWDLYRISTCGIILRHSKVSMFCNPT